MSRLIVTLSRLGLRHREGDWRWLVVLRQEDMPGREPGIRHVAELYDERDECVFPLATAWLSDYTKTMGSVMVDYVLVPDHLRRRGFASRLLRILSRRGGLYLEYTEAISDAGQALIDSLLRGPKGESHGC